MIIMTHIELRAFCQLPTTGPATVFLSCRVVSVSQSVSKSVGRSVVMLKLATTTHSFTVFVYILPKSQKDILLKIVNTQVQYNVHLLSECVTLFR